jgi:hypothetical protein
MATMFTAMQMVTMLTAKDECGERERRAVIRFALFLCPAMEKVRAERQLFHLAAIDDIIGNAK